jgi:hypothetical protein
MTSTCIGWEMSVLNSQDWVAFLAYLLSPESLGKALRQIDFVTMKTRKLNIVEETFNEVAKLNSHHQQLKTHGLRIMTKNDRIFLVYRLDSFLVDAGTT